MNKYCFRNCAYNDICKLSEEDTMQCKFEVIMCKYDIYESGYQNGIAFGYIPALGKEQMRIWLVGYNDAKDKNHKSLHEIDNI